MLVFREMCRPSRRDLDPRPGGFDARPPRTQKCNVVRVNQPIGVWSYAELVGLSHDVMNVRVQRRPRTREAALELAREQYVYCSDIVDQGVQTLSALAAVLMESDWWYFWWD